MTPLPKYLGKIFIFCFLQETLNKQLINALKIAFTTAKHQKEDDVAHSPHQPLHK